jgi:hypothetical protein
LQNDDGSVGINQAQASPGWPTGLAVLAWKRADSGFRTNIDRAVSWLLAARGKPQPRTPQMGHDSTLVGWPWVLGTHSWLEPTAFNVLALKAAGHDEHPRTREAVRLLLDRLLPTGGCNYGNTTVLGQQLRPHIGPTGVVLLALAGEAIHDSRLPKSLDYLRRELSPRTPCISLCYGLMGLAAHDQFPEEADAWLAQHAQRRDWKLALLALAALRSRSPFIHNSPLGV